MTTWLAIAIFAAAYILIATEWIHRVAAALGGAGLMLALGITDSKAAFFDELTGIDWNIIFLLLGMMVIVGVLKETGVFEYAAIWCAKKAKGKPFRVMVLLVVLTAVASALLDNVTTVLLVAPVTIFLCRKLGLPVVPYLIAEVLASNIGGAATLVGDPPNIIIASRAGFGFNDFLIYLAPLVVFLMVVFIFMCRWMFRKAFIYDAEKAQTVLAMSEKDSITDPRLLAKSLGVLAIVTVAFILHAAFHIEPAIVALLGGGVLLAISGLEPERVLKAVEWETLAFFAGLFVMVGGLIQTGVIEDAAEQLTSVAESHPFASAAGLTVVSAVLGAIVDNIPYVATVAPVVATIAIGNKHGDAFWWSLAAGADFGGNATPIGASANVVVLGIAEKHGEPISFWTFMKYGLPTAAVTVALTIPYIWLRFFA